MEALASSGGTIEHKVADRVDVLSVAGKSLDRLTLIGALAAQVGIEVVLLFQASRVATSERGSAAGGGHAGGAGDRPLRRAGLWHSWLRGSCVSADDSGVSADAGVSAYVVSADGLPSPVWIVGLDPRIPFVGLSRLPRHMQPAVDVAYFEDLIASENLFAIPRA